MHPLSLGCHGNRGNKLKTLLPVSVVSNNNVSRQIVTTLEMAETVMLEGGHGLQSTVGWAIAVFMMSISVSGGSWKTFRARIH